MPRMGCWRDPHERHGHWKYYWAPSCPCWLVFEGDWVEEEKTLQLKLPVSAVYRAHEFASPRAHQETPLCRTIDGTCAYLKHMRRVEACLDTQTITPDSPHRHAQTEEGESRLEEDNSTPQESWLRPLQARWLEPVGTMREDFEDNKRLGPAKTQ